MKKCVLIGVALSVLFAGVAGAAEMKSDKTLGEIHGAMWPESTGFAVKGECMQCHGSYEKLAEKTAHLEPNPHQSHMGNVNCTECHSKETAKPELMCNSCHNFTIREKKVTK